MNKTIIRILLLLSLVSIEIMGQNNHGYELDKPDFKYGDFLWIHSSAMNRDFPVLIFKPCDYTLDKSKKWPVVYMLHGTTDQPLNEVGIRTMYNPATRMQEMANQFNVIIVAPLIGNMYYMDAPEKPEIKAATLISTELTTFIDKNYRTENDRKGRILCGFSMGGYGAVSLLCRFPDIFSVAIQRAGVLNLATDIQDLKWDDVNEHVKALLGNFFSNGENYHHYSCFNLVNHIRHRNDIAFVIEVGKSDLLYKTNYEFHHWLNELKIPHIYSETEGGHEWNANTLRSLLSNLQYFNQTQFK